MATPSMTELGYEPTVSDLMTATLFTLTEDDTTETLEDLMVWRRIRHVPIINYEGLLVGLVSHSDFLGVAVSALPRGSEGEPRLLYHAIPVREIMRRDLVTATPEMSLNEAAPILFENKVGCLPVVQGRRLVGIITEADFVKAFSQWKSYFRDR